MDQYNAFRRAGLGLYLNHGMHSYSHKEHSDLKKIYAGDDLNTLDLI
jgi:hypothetical protein